jgi:hypothetical protein
MEYNKHNKWFMDWNYWKWSWDVFNRITKYNKCVYKCKRGRYSNVVTTLNQVLGQRNIEAMYMRGSIAGQGGFSFILDVV